jgi:hypothetical protein
MKRSLVMSLFAIVFAASGVACTGNTDEEGQGESGQQTGQDQAEIHRNFDDGAGGGGGGCKTMTLHCSDNAPCYYTCNP